MIKTKINSDLFNITKRLKAIDKKYFVVFNHKFSRFEVHNSSQIFNTLSVVCPYKTLDSRVVDFVLKTRVENSAKLIEEIEKHNLKNEQEKQEKTLYKSECMLKDIYSYASGGSKEFNYRTAFKNEWI